METMLTNLRLDDVRGAIGRFARWWATELLSLLPPIWQELARTRRDRLVVQLADTELTLSLCKGDTERQLGRYRLGQGEAIKAALAELPVGSAEVVLRLPEKDVLCSTLDLPVEAEANLRAVLAFEMDRQTPFKAEQVYYDAQIVAKPPGMRQMQVKLWVVPRKAVDDALERMAGLGLRPAVVNGPEGRPGEADTCAGSVANFLPRERRPPARRGAMRLNMALTALALLLLVAAVRLPLVQQRTLVANLESLLEEAQRQAKAMELLHDELKKFAEESRFLSEQWQDSPPIVPVLAEITRLLPDDTWISTLEISHGEVAIQGESPSASALIGLIEASPSFHNANFRSPVIQDQKTGRERFQLSAEIMVAPPP